MGKMVRHFVSFLPIILFAGAGTAAQAQPSKPKGHLGSSWVGEDGKMRQPRIRLAFNDDDHVLYGERVRTNTYRELRFDENRSTLQTGPYPAKSLAADKENQMKAVVDIDKSGNVINCEVTWGEGSLEMDMHACPHITRHAKFVPALNSEGLRNSARRKLIYVNYELFGGPKPKKLGPKPRPSHVNEARPLKPLTFAALGIDRSMRVPSRVKGIGGILAVGKSGEVNGCRLTQPTDVDILDLLACNRLISDIPFEPAFDTKAKASVRSEYGFYVKRK